MVKLDVYSAIFVKTKMSYKMLFFCKNVLLQLFKQPKKFKQILLLVDLIILCENDTLLFARFDILSFRFWLN